MAKSGRRRKRDWTALPDYLTAAILSRLGAVDVLENAQEVCMKWRRVSKDPLLWRKIDMRNNDDLDHDDYDAMLRHAVDRSDGDVLDINIERLGNDHVLSFIINSRSTMRRIRLCSCKYVSDEGLSKMVFLRSLEEVEITLCEDITHEGIRAVGESCLLLKSFKFNKEWRSEPVTFDIYEPDDFDDMYGYSFGRRRRSPPAHIRYVKLDDNADAIAIAEPMRRLQHLGLYGNRINDDGLRKILDFCPRLESLDLRRCLNLNMGIDLVTRCAERMKRLWLPHDSIEGKDFSCKSDGFCFSWTELPDDVTMSIMSRLGTIDILENDLKSAKN